MSGRHMVYTSLRADCPKCNAPALEWCTSPDGSPRQLSHPERAIAARSVPIVTTDQLAALDKLAADPAADILRSVLIAIRNKGWVRPIDPPLQPAPPGQRHRRRPIRRHEVTESGELVRQTAKRTE